MKLNKFNEPMAYCIRGQDQMSLFSEQQLQDLIPLENRPYTKRLFCLVEADDGHSWWQELERVREETPWQTCMKYKKEVLGRGYWICKYELR